MIRWFAKNSLTANFLMVGIILAGILVSLTSIPLEVRPSREFPIINIDVPYRGATPIEIEQKIAIPIEQALEELNGIKTITSNCNRNSARISLEMKSGKKPQSLLEEVERRVRGVNVLPSEIDAINFSIPDSSNWFDVINVVVQADLGLTELTKIAHEVRKDLLTEQSISRAKVAGGVPREFIIEVSPEKLKYYNLSADELANAIRNQSNSVAAGSIRYNNGSIALRPGTEASTLEEFTALPITLESGQTLSLSEIATVKDDFQDERKVVRYNGKPALIVKVYQTREQSALKIAKTVKKYVAENKSKFGSSISLFIWDDESYRIKGRLTTLTQSLLQGGILVFIILGLFLRPALAFWVVLGIPISFAGGALFMPLFGVTGNMMSLFAFILVLGIVVDDAIVTGESIFSRLKNNNEPALDSVVLGTKAVATPVTFGVITTIIAFLPLLSFDGYWGALTKQIPPVIAPVLLFSLIESKLILPSHLKHLNLNSDKFRWLNYIPDKCNAALEWFSQKVVRRVAQFCCKQRYLILSIFTFIALFTWGYWNSGKLGFQVFPAIDTYKMSAKVSLANDAKLSQTEDALNKVKAAAEQLQTEFKDAKGNQLITSILTSAGGHPAWGIRENQGWVILEILPTEQRKGDKTKNKVIENRWKELIGTLSEVKALRVRSQNTGRYIGNDEPEPVEIQLRGAHSGTKIEVSKKIKALLREKGIFENVWDYAPSAVNEFSINLNSYGKLLGLNEQALSRQMRNAFVGNEIKRIPNEEGLARVQLKLPEEVREDPFAISEIPINLTSGDTVPLSAVATITPIKGIGNFERKDGAATFSIFAAPSDENLNLVPVSEELASDLNRLLEDYPEFSWRYSGYLAEYEETQKKFTIGVIALIFVLYMLLALPFNSLFQPFFVIIAIPFGIIGAILGHVIMDITPSYLSLFGLMALTGVVVNDSLVLVDAVNTLRKSGLALVESLVEACVSRFRPILLTSLTTFFGLFPLMNTDSIQAKFLVPMAVSLGYGILFATVITLILIPSIYLASNDFKKLITRVWNWYKAPFNRK